MKKLSIVLPVKNEAESLKMMIPVFDAVLERPYEILVIYDFPEDNSVEAVERMQQKYSNVRLVFNDLGPGVPNAIKKAASVASGDVIFITVVDEIFSMAVINDMIKLIDHGYEMVNTTRHALGGKNIRDSLSEKILSLSANKLFQIITGSVLTDNTTGIKMFKKSALDKINIEAKSVGWAVAFELSVKAQVLGLKIAELPIVSVDRLFGGNSTFKVGPWVLEYWRWFFRGIKQLNRFKHKRTAQ